MKGSIPATRNNIKPLFVLSIIAFLLLLPVMFFAAVLVVGLTILAATTNYLSGYFSHALLLLAGAQGDFQLSKLLTDPQFILTSIVLAVPTLIWIQIVLLSQYTAYRDIFLESELD